MQYIEVIRGSLLFALHCIETIFECLEIPQTMVDQNHEIFHIFGLGRFLHNPNISNIMVRSDGNGWICIFQ